MSIPESDRTLARLLIEQGLASRAIVDECLAQLERLDAGGVTLLPKLGELLVRRGVAMGSDPHQRTVSHAATPAISPTSLPDEAARAPESDRLGKFIRTSKLGEGGMGEVWKAWDADLRRWVALKFLKSTDPAEAARFQREAQVAARLIHPNIASIYETGTAMGRHYIAMQFVEGTTLHRDAPERAARLIRDAALAVHAAHEQGVVHRDLKPANIMLQGDRVFVMDFGLARSSDVAGLSVSGTVVGTPSYMPPEQARGQGTAVGPRSDVYSLGATLYELLTGRPPFAGTDIYAVLTRVIEEEPVPPAVDGDLQTIVLRCLEKDPDRRYATAKELADDLGRWLEGEPIQARPASLLYRVRKKIQKKKAAAASALLAVLLGTALTIYVIAIRPKANLLAAEDALFNPLFAKLGDLSRSPDGRRRAIALLDQALARHQGSWNAWLQKGHLHELLGEVDAALAAYERAHQLKPDLDEARYRRGRLLLELHRDLDVARRELEAVKEQNEFAAGARARLALMDGDFELASRICDEQEAAADRVVDLLHIRAYLCNQQWTRWYDPQRALDLFTRCLQLAPGHVAILANRSSAWRRVGDLEKAIADAEEAIRINPEYPLGWTNRGSFRALRGRHAEALEDLTKAVALDRREATSWSNRGLCLSELGRFTEALVDLDTAVQLEPTRFEYHANRAGVLARLGRDREAAAGFEKSLQLRPGNGEVHYARATSYMKLGEIEKAWADYDRAIALNPRFAAAWADRGYLRSDKGDTKGALEDYTKAIELEPRALFYRLRGVVQFEAGDLEASIRDNTMAIELDPADPNAWYHRGLSHAYASRLKQAADDIAKALLLADAKWKNRKEAEETLRKIR